MPEQLKQRVETCYQQAEAFFKRRFPRPEVSFKLRGQKAGVAHLHENLLRFNLQLYRENQEDFLRQTVAHEVAHLVAHQLFGDRIQAHGCGFHAIRPPSPLSSGQAFQGHLATCSTAIRPGSRSAATQGWHC
ncbi:SprT-like domain-containing protein [Pseudomonas putida]|uniref:SprT-like domain-containing protein n=1 Tax=Pseudomonas putida TaxID=303 RepID=UPI002DBE6BD3|nr:SprT-like domain-containing protein [Pseudomonas putida]WRW02563.1 SprT-like domain-containing protein [Pseudomonas putida]